MSATSPHAIGLSHFAPFGSTAYPRLFTRFQTYEGIWNASYNELRALNVTEKTATKFLEYRSSIDLAKLVDDLAKLGIDTVDRDDPRFPKALKTIHDPPIILYVRGTLPASDSMIGIVGSRDATPYGLEVAEQFASELAKAGLVVVSGLARGIDQKAHQGAMSAGGKTIAVLAHGHEHLLGSKRHFGDKIVEHGGAVITEQPPRRTAEKFHFPIRNRIIAGMSHGVLVVEAKLPSGSLTTADSAIRENREVFAIPGPITSLASTGTNQLLKDGAHLVTTPDDILIAFGFQKAPVIEPLLHPAVAEDPEHALLLKYVSMLPVHVDELARSTHLPISRILATLTILEIHGKVRNLGNMYYSL